jgi:hypothetical protein
VRLLCHLVVTPRTVALSRTRLSLAQVPIPQGHLREEGEKLWGEMQAISDYSL